MTDLKLTAEACRAARALLKWTTAKLAQEAGVSPNTINRLESGGDVREAAQTRIRTGLEAAGVEILNGNAPGARLRPPGAAE